MRNWISGTATVLGALLVLSGSAIIVLRALNRTEPTAEATTTEVPTGPVSRWRNAARRLQPAERLIGWGIVLLLVAALAAGALSFNVSVGAGTS